MTIAVGYIILVAAVLVETVMIALQPRKTFTLPAEFQRVDGNAGYAEWSHDSGMREVEGAAVFALWNGVVRARFTFADAHRTVMESAGLSDPIGRPLVFLDWAKQTAQWNEYAPLRRDPDPVATYIDSSGDFIPDKKIDWVTGEAFCPDPTGAWVPCPAVPQEVSTRD
jgi:hypothetical protein